jgi:hypothetical protein
MKRPNILQEDALTRPDLPITPVPHAALRPETFPQRGAPFEALVAFAYTFDGYERFGMEACAQLANAALSRYYRERALPEPDFDTLRACLFFEARRWQLHKQEPDTKGLLYMHALIDAIAAACRAR